MKQLYFYILIIVLLLTGCSKDWNIASSGLGSDESSTSNLRGNYEKPTKQDFINMLGDGCNQKPCSEGAVFGGGQCADLAKEITNVGNFRGGGAQNLITENEKKGTPLSTLDDDFSSVKQCNLILYDTESGFDTSVGHVAIVVSVDYESQEVLIMEQNVPEKSGIRYSIVKREHFKHAYIYPSSCK